MLKLSIITINYNNDIGLKKTIKSVSNSDTEILSPDLSHALRDKSLIEIETYDISLLKLLSKGLILDEKLINKNI